MINGEKNYLEKLKKIKIFAGCDDETISTIVKNSRIKSFKDKETILEQNKITTR